MLKRHTPATECERWITDLDSDADMLRWDRELDAVLFEFYERAEVRCHFLYRIYDSEGALLYVGITGRARRRIVEHMRQQEWWPAEQVQVSVVAFSTENAAHHAEVVAIQRERPLHNKQHRVEGPEVAGFELIPHMEVDRRAA